MCLTERHRLTCIGFNFLSHGSQVGVHLACFPSEDLWTFVISGPISHVSSAVEGYFGPQCHGGHHHWDLKYQENLKYDQISQRTGLSVGNVGYKLHHLLKALADNLRRLGIDSPEG